VSRRNLLEWVTAAQTHGARRPTVTGQYRLMAGGTALGLIVPALAVAASPAALPLALPFAVLWLAAPAVTALVSRPWPLRGDAVLRPAEIARLRQIARKTWRFFETFVTERDHFLPPDNFQETPRPEVAHRTSPTNIGLYLLSVTVAHDMGWIGRADAALRLERTLQTLRRMPRHRGHLYNWHDTQDLRVLDPAYVSSVDSGNLAGHLIAVARACREWSTHPVAAEAMRAGVLDTILLAQAALPDRPDSRPLADLLGRMASAAAGAADLATLLALARQALTQAGSGPDAEAQYWAQAVHDSLTGHMASPVSRESLLALEQQARDLALEMDFGFLLHPEKKLLSIGFSVATNTLDSNCYDLLASEARLASLFAIAKGDVPTRHWFRLGRSATPVGAGSALISWSGSMFEYLMPSLVMRAPAGSVLEQTNRLIVARQQTYAASLGIPWGISESSYNARDLHMTYQYSNFGVPGLGLKRGLRENRVIAPYASGLAAMVDARGALQNYDRLARIGAEGRFGFYEAVDFTASRVPAGLPHALVRSFMAHHQGMTITAIANVVQDGRLRARFHAEPMIQAVELLLQERVPRDAVSALPRAEGVQVAPVETADAPAVRLFEAPDSAEPTAHLLSNGTYGVMLTPTGAGFSRWRDMAVTRWRPDATQNALGSFLFLRDVVSGMQWSPAVQPVADAAARQDAVFGEHLATYTHRHRLLTTKAEIVVSSEDDAEARRVTLTNTGRVAREVDVTSYAELVLAPSSADFAHPAFSKLFVVTDYLEELGVIIATRRRRSPGDPEVWAAHIAVVEGTETAPMQFETDRARFIGRGNSIRQPVSAAEPLTGTVGTVLDPVFSIRRRISIPVGRMARITFWTLLADAPDKLLDMVDRHRDPSAFERAETLAWTQAQVQLRHLGISRATALAFQQLSGGLLRADLRLRATPLRIASGLGPQAGLWPLGISGDLPVILVQIDDADDLGAVREALNAQEYWRMRQFAVDLVILNDRASSYVQDLQIGIEAAIRAAQSRPRTAGHDGPAQGSVHAVRADLITPEAKALLLAVAGAVLVAGRGDIGGQLAAATGTTDLRTAVFPPVPPAAAEAETPPDLPELEFFNGTGGFAENGREYVTVLQGGHTTPAPWINVVSNPGFGFQVSAEGGGHVWSENSRENQLTPWSNDPVSDPPGEAIYLHDLDSGILWTPTALPIRTGGTYVARHGFGYSRFQHGGQGILCDVLQIVPLDAPVKISRIRLTNRTRRMRRLSVTGYVEWVLGPSRSATAPFVVTEIDQGGAVLARNPWAMGFPGRVAFADLGEGATATASRMDFLGPAGRCDAPDGVRRPLSGQCGPGLDPCAALQRQVVLAPGASVDLVFQIGQEQNADAARALIARIRSTDIDAVLADVTRHWADLLGAVQVRSPDRALDVMLNGWLLYQTLACRIWARAGFYQASGAYGFRDQLQDGMALTFRRPEMTREHLLRAAGRQFPEGDVQHWWLPHSGQGVRTRISDDRVWLGYGVARYSAVSGDTDILDVPVPFLQGPALRPGAHDDFFLPGPSEESASLFEHCARGLDQAMALTGANGMPLIGTGDWNDGMNRVGEGGTGTSVWLGWLLIATIGMMAPLADRRDPARAARWRAHAESVRQAIERDGWDGEWYRRGTFDDGTLLGSATSDECRIDSIAQSWAVLSGAAQPDRARRAMASVTQHLIRPDPGLALLFTPPFDRTPLDPGYIKGYPAGLRENGGQYSHAAMWAVLAHARLGDGDAAAGLFALLNPINHALTPQAAARYKVEPYVIAADVYSTSPHEGRGGWSWYTGSAGWMYRAGIEGLLGLNRAGPVLTLAPCFPRHWPRLEASVRVGGCSFDIVIDNAAGGGTGIAEATLDGVAQALVSGAAVLPVIAGGHHRVALRLGPPTPPPVSPG
jgi:cyclic beta-1,2-glucan synthetase